jgi:hypothetical protein
VTSNPPPLCPLGTTTVTFTAKDGAPTTDFDWHITGPLTVDLRAERSGTGSGRVYTITVQCTDKNGNFARSAVKVTVPKSQGEKGK